MSKTIQKFSSYTAFESIKSFWGALTGATWETVVTKNNLFSFSIHPLSTDELAIEKKKSFISTIENIEVKYDDDNFNPTFIDNDFEWSYFSDDMEWNNIDSF